MLRAMTEHVRSGADLARAGGEPLGLLLLSGL
jgi:hypothetical protein